MILVTGGTGLVGSHLLYFLLKDNEKVRAIHRKSSDLLAVKHVFSYYGPAAEELFERIDWMEANIADIPALTQAFQGITHVYHAAAYISFDPKNYYKLKKSNIEGTANIVNLCLSEGIEKLCYVSTIGTLGKAIGNDLVSETTEWDPEAKNSVYGITKYGAEMEVWRGTQEGLSVIIVNPGVILGAGFWNDGSGAIIKRAALKRGYFTTGSTGFVDVLDVVTCMIGLMHGTMKNEKYVLVGDNLPFKSLQTQLAALFSKKPAKPISKSRLLFFSTLDAWSSRLSGRKRSLIKSTVDTLYTDSAYDASKIEKELNFEFTPWKETLERVVERYSMPS